MAFSWGHVSGTDSRISHQSWFLWIHLSRNTPNIMFFSKLFPHVRTRPASPLGTPPCLQITGPQGSQRVRTVLTDQQSYFSSICSSLDSFVTKHPKYHVFFKFFPHTTSTPGGEIRGKITKENTYTVENSTMDKMTNNDLRAFILENGGTDEDIRYKRRDFLLQKAASLVNSSNTVLWSVLDSDSSCLFWQNQQVAISCLSKCTVGKAQHLVTTEDWLVSKQFCISRRASLEGDTMCILTTGTPHLCWRKNCWQNPSTAVVQFSWEGLVCQR